MHCNGRVTHSAFVPLLSLCTTLAPEAEVCVGVKRFDFEGLKRLEYSFLKLN